MRCPFTEKVICAFLEPEDNIIRHECDECPNYVNASKKLAMLFSVPSPTLTLKP